jgi:hypothetical protein
MANLSSARGRNEEEGGITDAVRSAMHTLSDLRGRTFLLTSNRAAHHESTTVLLKAADQISRALENASAAFVTLRGARITGQSVDESAPAKPEDVPEPSISIPPR